MTLKQATRAANILLAPKGFSSPTLYEPLLINHEHHQRHHGLGIVVFESKPHVILDGATFRSLRDTQRARIFTDNKEEICGALGLPIDEPGIRLHDMSMD